MCAERINHAARQGLPARLAASGGAPAVHHSVRATVVAKVVLDAQRLAHDALLVQADRRANQGEPTAWVYTSGHIAILQE